MHLEDKYSEYEKKARSGDLPDELNPIFLFNLTRTELLVQIVSGELDAVELAQRQLKNRGLDSSGNFVGWKK